jgi:hypothetical protein
VVNNVIAPSTASIEVNIGEVTWQRIRGPQAEVQFQTADLVLQAGELATDSTTTSSDTTPTQEDDETFVVPETDTTAANTPAGEAFTQLTGMVTNASAYGFERVRIVAVLRNQSQQIVGMQQAVWSNVGSFTTIPLAMNWLRRFTFDTEPELLIYTDYWDTNNLILPGQD